MKQYRNIPSLKKILSFLATSEFILREALLGLRRGGWMNWATVSTTAILLFLYGLSFLASWSLGSVLDNLGNQFEVSVFLDHQENAYHLKDTILRLSGVASVEVIPRETAWSMLVHDLGISNIEEATSQLHGNPLVDEIKVKILKSEDVSYVADNLKNIEGIDDVIYIQEIIQKLAQLNKVMKLISSCLIAILSFTVVSIVTMTIRLTISARKQEIEVMQLVGSLRKAIYLPFICQGSLLGIVGAILAGSCLYCIYQLVGNFVAHQPELVQHLASSLKISFLQGLSFAAMLISIGSSLGIIGSSLAVRKFSLR
jgi:cell division transport system permease protein